MPFQSVVLEKIKFKVLPITLYGNGMPNFASETFENWNMLPTIVSFLSYLIDLNEITSPFSWTYSLSLERK